MSSFPWSTTLKKLIHRKQSREVRKMDENKHIPPDGQDQMGTEIKKLKRSIALLWICVILLNIDNLILSNRIDQIVGLLERFAKFSGIVTQVIEKLVYVLH